MGTGTLLYGCLNLRFELFLCPITASVAHQGEASGEQTSIGEVIDGGEELLARQVAGYSKDHEAGRACDAGETLIEFVTQGVVPLLGIRSQHADNYITYSAGG